MKKLKRLLFLIFATISIISNIYADDNLEIISPNYFGEKDLIYENIHFLEDELLSFEICSQETKNINAKISCEDKNINVELFEKMNSKNSCFYSNFDLSKVTCDEFTLEISYEEFNKEKIITRTFEKEKESKLINHVLSKNYETLNSLDLSYYLLIQNLIEGKENQKSKDIYELLKSQRDNTQKCWEDNSCDTLITSKISSNLKTSGYDDNSRLIEDSKIFLEKKTLIDEEINYPEVSIENEIFKTQIFLNTQFSSSETECDLDIDYSDEEKTYSFDDDTDFDDKFIIQNSEEKINISCEDDIDEIEFKYFEDLILDKTLDNDDSYSYKISDSDKENYNDFEIDIFFNHEFSTNEEIECDIEIDGDETTYTFDDDSSFENLRISENIEDDLSIDCDNDFDTILVKIYSGDVNTETYSNTDNFEFELSQEKKENTFKTNTLLKYDFENSDEKLKCTLTYDSKSKEYTLDEDDISNNIIKIEDILISNNLAITCDKTLKEIKFEIFDKFSKKQIEENKENVKSLSYSIKEGFSEYSCISKSSSCEFESSLNTLISFKNQVDEKENLEKFVKSFKQKEDENYFIEFGDKFENSGKYLLYKDDEDILNSLKITQNNDGSWGDKSNVKDKIKATANIIIGMQNENSKSEYIEDGKKWIYFNEPENGWGNIEKDSLAYLAIKEQIKPRIIITQINSISKNTKITIENPTIYNMQNIKIDFSKEIKEHLTYRESLGDLNGEESLSFNISTNKEFTGKLTGNLMITGINNKKEIELINIPITIESEMPFKFENLPIYITEDDLFVDIKLIANSNNFNLTCTIKNPFESISETVQINQDTKKISLSNKILKTGNFDIELSCSQNELSFTGKEKVEIIFSKKTFSSNENQISLIEPEEFSLQISNKFESKQEISIEIDGDFKDIIIPAENKKMLAFNETREIYFTIENNEIFQNLSEESKGSITISGINYTKKIPIYKSTFIEENSNEKSIPWIWIIIGIITLTFTVLVIKRYNELNQEEPETQEVEEEIILDDMDFGTK